MKACWLSYYYKWKFHPYIHHWQLLALIVEHYSQEHLLLQRSILTLRCGEAKAHHDTPKPFLSLILAKRLDPKSMFYELWGSIYNKGWGDSWNSPLWLFYYPHDSSTSLTNNLLHSDCSHSTNDTWNFSYNMFTNNIHFPHVSMWDKIG